MKQLVVSVLVLFLGLMGCAEENLQPQSATQSEASSANDPQKPVIPQHNLSQVADAKAVTPEMLATIEVGKTTTAQLIELLGEIKPFTLGDGKQIFRYDVGKFIFDADGVLLRQHINH
ncbi:MAG: hypothetical protein V7752_07850 [Halopseudomonas sp.]